MKARVSFAIVFCAISLNAIRSNAQLITLDPDNYADGTILNTIIPGLNMITAGTNNLPYPPRSFDVTAVTDTFPNQPPTGDKVFAHASVPFWNDARRLRMDFAGAVSTISIDFMGSNSQVPETGQLEVYGSSGQLLGVYTTHPLLGGQFETMTIEHGNPDIAWGVAYTLNGDSVFGRLDHLVFSQPVTVPEPGVTWLAVLGGLGLLWFRKRR